MPIVGIEIEVGSKRHDHDVRERPGAQGEQSQTYILSTSKLVLKFLLNIHFVVIGSD